MDALAGLLDGPRARGAFLLRAVFDPPWSIRVRDEAPITLMAVVRGSAWVVPDDGDPLELGVGDVAVARGPEPYTIADSPSTEPLVIVHPGQHCTDPAGRPLAQEMGLGVRSWGNDPDGATTVLVGTYQRSGEVSRSLLTALPTLLVLPHGAWDSPLMALLGEEIAKDDPGQDAVLDRLLDLLLIAVLRTWFSRPEARAPAWYLALGDPVVGRALRLIHGDPARPWTVAALAAASGVSRAALARRFTHLVGEPPMAYLTGWRLALAADLLRFPDTTVASVARKVGYATPFALSTAFKRVHGVSPQQYRLGEPPSEPRKKPETPRRRVRVPSP
ncbi:AraC family transcriptional regulator [Actinorugispora endophytica]|uniref:AraC-like DNA-binding protein n=1 Tax=Actinorugispora endophytica TaxID=1605990 RepID=A0A4R6VCJ3_9ACTN|nr:AraC family transcriptional regulator [Actinorugispora endophytica]TDQ54486.1 AraC-like DNA-binding protein [Actinorugispora endophytica]